MTRMPLCCRCGTTVTRKTVAWPVREESVFFHRVAGMRAIAGPMARREKNKTKITRRPGAHGLFCNRLLRNQARWSGESRGKKRGKATRGRPRRGSRPWSSPCAKAPVVAVRQSPWPSLCEKDSGRCCVRKPRSSLCATALAVAVRRERDRRLRRLAARRRPSAQARRARPRTASPAAAPRR